MVITPGVLTPSPEEDVGSPPPVTEAIELEDEPEEMLLFVINLQIVVTVYLCITYDNISFPMTINTLFFTLCSLPISFNTS